MFKIKPTNFLITNLNYYNWVVYIFILMMIVACSSSQPTPIPITPTQIAESIPISISTNTDPLIQVIDTEIITQDNCGGTGTISNTVERTKEIAYTIDMGTEVSVNANGEIGLFGTNVGVGGAVAKRFGIAYGTAESITKGINVEAPPNTYMEYTIHLAETWETGDVSITSGNVTQIYPFAFRKGFTVSIVNKRNLGCPNSSVNPPTNSHVTPASSTNTIIPPTSTSSESTNIDIDEVLANIIPGQGGIEHAAPWWKTIFSINSENTTKTYDPTEFPGDTECFGIAWNAMRIPHTIFVFQSAQTLDFQNGGTYVTVCLSNGVKLSKNDMGRIQAEWSHQEYGGAWQVNILD